MKLADDFLVKCLNYQNEAETIEKNKPDEYRYYGYGRNYVFQELCKQLFIVEEQDFNIAIELCKEYKRSIQGKAYKHNLNLLKETGTYPCSGNPADFIAELRNELVGRRSRNSGNKNMLVAEDLKNEFPEWKEIRAAREILEFVSRTTEIEKRCVQAQNTLNEHQEKINSIHDATEAGKSVLEIVEQLREKEED